MKIKPLIIILFIHIIFNSTAYSATFKGTVIDAETKVPIEGAVVLASWREEQAGSGAGAHTRLKDVKETLTDKKGEWAIEGPKGREGGNITAIFSFLTGSWHTRPPTFIIFKPGYVSYPKMISRYDCFIARPYINSVHGQEGIILIRPGDTKEKRKKYLDELRKHASGSVPFISEKHPEKKLRTLNFSFEYDKEISWIVGNDSVFFRNYTIVGLQKAQTREDRLKSLPTPRHKDGDRGIYKKQREFLRLIDEESRYLGIPDYQILKELENER